MLQHHFYTAGLAVYITLRSRVQRVCSWARKHWWVGLVLGAPLFILDGLPVFAQVALGLAAGLVFALGWLSDMGRQTDAALARNGKPPAWGEDASEK